MKHFVCDRFYTLNSGPLPLTCNSLGLEDFPDRKQNIVVLVSKGLREMFDVEC